MKRIILPFITLLCCNCSVRAADKQKQLLSPEEASLVQATLPRAIILNCAVTQSPQNNSLTNSSFLQQSLLSPSSITLQLPVSTNTSFTESVSPAKSAQASAQDQPLVSPRDATDCDSLLGSQSSRALTYQPQQKSVLNRTTAALASMLKSSHKYSRIKE